MTLKYGKPVNEGGIKNGTQPPATEPIRSGPAERQEAKLALGLKTTREYLLRISGDLGVSIPEDKMEPISDAIEMLGKIERKESLDGMTPINVLAVLLKMTINDLDGFLKTNIGFRFLENDSEAKPILDASAFLTKKWQSLFN